MAQPTQLVISYGSSSSATLPIPAALINTSTGVTDSTNAIKNIFLANGFFLPGTTTFIPASQITQVQAQ
jgi:hypothetical protein